MDAFFAKNRLSAYLDGSLSEAEAAEVEQALARDSALRGEFEAMKRAVTLLREAGPVRAPADLHAKIMERLAAEPMPGGRLAWLRRPLGRLPMEGLALAAAALLVVVAIQWKPGQPSQEAAPPESPPQEVAKSEEVAATPAVPSTPAATTTSPGPVPRKAPRDLDLGKAIPVPSSGDSRKDKSAAVVPDEPYVPEWERQEAAQRAASSAAVEAPPDLESAITERVSMRTAMYYRINAEDPAILAVLARLAERSGGSLVDASGAPAAARELTIEENYEKVSLVIPPGKLGEVTSALRALGAQGDPPPAAAPLYGTDQVVLVVDVLYKP